MNILQKTHSKNNNEIVLLDCWQVGVSSRVPEKTILIIGVFHGDEPQGEFLINKFYNNFSCSEAASGSSQAAENEDSISEFRENDYSEPKNKLLLLPCLNPDGKAANTRQNANGVDLNRNFAVKNWEKSDKDDYWGGEFPASEAETTFVSEIIDSYKPDAVITFHAPYKIVNYDGPAIELARKVSELTGYPVQESIGYPTPGSFGTYCGVERQIPTITLELGEDENETTLWERTKGLFEYLLYQY